MQIFGRGSDDAAARSSSSRRCSVLRSLGRAGPRLPRATLIGCWWRHTLIIATAILTTATTWRIMPIRLVHRYYLYQNIWMVWASFGRELPLAYPTLCYQEFGCVQK